mmetsp:Transcript_17339/g.38001  ORF Transcript_17339/g.38001 Transcript_17339/m.38001 type:complete len:118 (+) Transcript_17339:412-765(+)
MHPGGMRGKNESRWIDPGIRIERWSLERHCVRSHPVLEAAEILSSAAAISLSSRNIVRTRSSVSFSSCSVLPYLNTKSTRPHPHDVVKVSRLRFVSVNQQFLLLFFLTNSSRANKLP